MGSPKITIVEREDLGPVLARADHQENVVEVNGKAFYRLPPMVQEFVLCHEVCHLRHNEWDEERTNALASRLFLSRAHDEDDLAARREFLSYIDGEGGYANFDPLTLIGAIGSAFSLGSTVFGIIKNRNAGWYSWDRATQRANLRVMLDQAFTQSRRSSKHSAEEFLWAQLQNYTNKDDSLSKFLSRGDNSWVKAEIRAYEEEYGFSLGEVTPLDLTAFPLLIVAIGAVVGWAVFTIIKNRK